MQVCAIPTGPQYGNDRIGFNNFFEILTTLKKNSVVTLGLTFLR